MFVGVVALCFQRLSTRVALITECHNSHKHIQSPLTIFIVTNDSGVEWLVLIARCHNSTQHSLSS